MNLKKHVIKILIALGIAIVLVLLPVIPVPVAPAVTVRAVDGEGKPVSGVTIVQFWNHYTYESVDARHTTEVVSDDDGYAAFSEKKLHVSVLKLVFSWVAENTIGVIDIHGSYGIDSSFVVSGYKTKQPFNQCRIECKNDEPIIVVGDKIRIDSRE